MVARRLPNFTRFRGTLAKVVELTVLGQETARRLVQDEGMAVTWERLLSEGVTVENSATEAAPPALLVWLVPRASRRLTDDFFPGVGRVDILHPLSLREQACVAVLCCSTIEIWLGRKAMTSEEVRRRTDDIRCTLKTLYSIRDDLMTVDPVRDRQTINDTIRIVEKLQDGFVRHVTGRSPYVISVDRDHGGDVNVRARVRAIATHLRKIYGEYRYGAVAAISSVGLETKVTREDVRRWCEDGPR